MRTRPKSRAQGEEKPSRKRGTVMAEEKKTAAEIFDDDYGEKWFSDDALFEEDLVSVWGRKWSVSSEVGKLKACLVRRPGKEIEIVKNPADWRWGGVMDPQKARDQHDAFTEIYRDHGVEVFYVEDQREDRP